MLIKFDYHIHSYHSYDSVNNPRDILKISKKKEINAVSVTDHNTIKGSLELKKYKKDFPNILTINGVEIKTEIGDLIVLGIQEELNTRDPLEILDIAYSNNYVTILPHPYVRSKFHKVNVKEFFNKIDLIEAFNARSLSKMNKKAKKLAEVLKKPITAGSDAHILAEIGSGITFVYLKNFSEEELLKSLKKGLCKGVLVKKSLFIYRITSIMIQFFKRIF